MSDETQLYEKFQIQYHLAVGMELLPGLKKKKAVCTLFL